MAEAHRHLRGLRMLQHIAQGLLHDGDHVLGTHGIQDIRVACGLNMPRHVDTAPVQHRLHTVAQPRQAINQRVGATVHRIHDKAQIQHALFQRPQRLRLGGHLRVQQHHGVDQLGADVVVKLPRNALALGLQFCAGTWIAAWPPLQGAGQLYQDQQPQQDSGDDLHGQDPLHGG